MKRTALVGAIAFALPVLVMAAPRSRVEFNEVFIHAPQGGSVDLERFAVQGYVAAGDYVVDVYVNGVYVKQSSLRFVEEGGEQGAQPCIDSALLEGFPIKAGALIRSGQGCGALVGLEGASAVYRSGQSRLDVSLPQTLLARDYNRYVAPSQWDDGIAVLLVDYRLAYSHAESIDGKSDSLSAYGVLGANVGPWRLRGNYQLESGSYRNGFDMTWPDVTLFRDLREQGARITLGKTYLTSSVFDSVNFNGIKVETDERMLPSALRGYAPRIEGVARTNAKVTIRQNERLLYAENVPPGPFVIDDLHSVAQGELIVTVEEADGENQQFSVASSSVPFLTRKGAVRYKVAIGSPSASPTSRKGGLVQDTPDSDRARFVTGEASYGLTATTSTYGGTILAEGYASIAAGAAKDAGQLGAFSLDVTRAWTGLDKTLVGNSYRFSYAKLFQEPTLDVRVFAYRFSERDYVGFDQFVDIAHRLPAYRERERIAASMATRIGGVFLALSGQRSRYWNASPSTTFNFSANKMALIGGRNVGFNLSIQDAAGVLDGRYDDRSVYLSVSVPLDGGSSLRASARRAAGRYSADVRWSGSHARNSFGLAAGFDGHEPSVFGSFQREASTYTVDASASHFGNHQRAWSMGLRSSILVHAGGITAGNGSQGSTRVLVDTRGIPNVPLLNTSARTNSSGYSILSWVPAYELQDVRVDTDRLPTDVDVRNPFQRKAYTDGAVGHVIFDARNGANMLARLALSDGARVPFGASVLDADSGLEIGIVNDDGTVFLSGVNPWTRLKVRWGNQECNVPTVPAPLGANETISLTCRSDAFAKSS